MQQKVNRLEDLVVDDVGQSQQHKYPVRVLESVVQLDHNRVNHSLIEATVHYILRTTKSGGVLVFLPGLFDITTLTSSLTSHYSEKDVWIVQLHSTLSTVNQQKVFGTPPKGVRKVVLSTNIAETSITVNDIVYVIDSGKLKESQYDATRKMGMLVETWESKANATQRKGRAGRVQPGVCFKMYSRLEYDDMLGHQLPEIKRTPLEHICLQIKLLGLGGDDGLRSMLNTGGSGKQRRKTARRTKAKFQQVMQMALEPPGDDMIASAVGTLTSLHALTKEEDITPLGVYLAKLPVGNVKIGKMLIMAAVFGCVGPVVKVAALLGNRSPFMNPQEKEDRGLADEARQQFSLTKDGRRVLSDHFAMMHALEEWMAMRRDRSKKRSACYDWARKKFLHWKTLETCEGLCSQYLTALADIGFLTGTRRSLSWQNLDSLPEDTNASNYSLIEAVICSGLYPNVIKVEQPEEKGRKTMHGIATIKAEVKDIKFFARTQTVASSPDESKSSASGPSPTQHKNMRVFLHPSSVVFSNNSYSSPWLVYLQIMQTSKVWVYDCSMVQPYALLLFGGDIGVEHTASLVTVDEWIK